MVNDAINTNNTSKDNVNMVLTTNKKQGLFKYLPCYLVFYDTKVVFAHISSEKQKEENNALRDSIKAEGKGFFKGTGEMLKYWFTYGEKYYGMNISDVLAEDSENFELDYSNINKFVFRATKMMTDESSTDNTGKIIIQAENNKYKLTHNYKDDNKKIKDVLTRLVSNSLKYKGGGFGVTIKLGGTKDGFR